MSYKHFVNCNTHKISVGRGYSLKAPIGRRLAYQLIQSLYLDGDTLQDFISIGAGLFVHLEKRTEKLESLGKVIAMRLIRSESKVFLIEKLESNLP